MPHTKEVEHFVVIYLVSWDKQNDRKGDVASAVRKGTLLRRCLQTAATYCTAPGFLIVYILATE